VLVFDEIQSYKQFLQKASAGRFSSHSGGMWPGADWACPSAPWPFRRASVAGLPLAEASPSGQGRDWLVA